MSGMGDRLRSRARRLNAQLWPERILLPPEWLVLGVNNVCNLHCRMCDVGLGRDDTTFARNLTGTRPVDMPMELFERVVEQAQLHAPRARLGFAFTEPLMWPHLVPALERARQAGLSCAVTTNGLLLPRLAGALCEAGLDELSLSLDGLEATHDQVRGRQGSFARAVAGLEAVLARPRRPQVGVFFTLTPWNVGQAADFVRFFARYPLRALGFMHTNYTTAAMAAAHNARWGGRYPATPSNVGPFDPADMDLARLLADLSAARQVPVAFPVGFQPALFTADALERFYRRGDELVGRRCSDAARTLMIKSDGSAIPAHGRCYEVAAGNLYRQPLPEVWNSAALAGFRRALRDAGGLLPACARCCSAY